MERTTARKAERESSGCGSRRGCGSPRWPRLNGYSWRWSRGRRGVARVYACRRGCRRSYRGCYRRTYASRCKQGRCRYLCRGAAPRRSGGERSRGGRGRRPPAGGHGSIGSKHQRKRHRLPPSRMEIIKPTDRPTRRIKSERSASFTQSDKAPRAEPATGALPCGPVPRTREWKRAIGSVTGAFVALTVGGMPTANSVHSRV